MTEMLPKCNGNKKSAKQRSAGESLGLLHLNHQAVHAPHKTGRVIQAASLCQQGLIKQD
jgi:hypothetical protein